MMPHTASTWFALALLAAFTLPAPAQDLEPGVQTSPGAAPASSSGAVSAPAPVRPSKPPTATPPVPASAAAAAASGAARTPKADAAAGAATKNKQDRIELGTTEISGNRELPKVMYVVPWRRPDLGDLAGRPPNSLLDEALTPVDRDVFRRQNRYYEALQSGVASKAGDAAAPQATPTPRDEK